MIHLHLTLIVRDPCGLFESMWQRQVWEENMIVRTSFLS